MTESLAELKTTQEEQADLVRRYVDEYAALALEADRIKQRMDWLKGQFETLATGALKDTKLLSISYWGSQNSRVTVTNTATVKPISLTMVKKVKGRYEKDKALLEKVAGLPEQEASDWAFLAAEVINWEWLAQVLEAAGWEGTTQEAIDIIRAAVIVEEGMKVGVEAEQPEV